MVDIIGGIAAATEGLKLVNELRKIDKELDKAELKLRLVEVADKLLDSKQALQEAQSLEFDLRKEVARLHDALALKARLRDENGLLFEVDAEDTKIGEPYCNHCFVKEGKLFRLRRGHADGGPDYRCDHCEKGAGRVRAYPSIVSRSDYDPFD